MNKIETIIELFKAGNKPIQIAQIVGLTPQRINQILKKEGFKQSNFNYSPKITKEIAGLIFSFHGEGKNCTEIAKAVNLTPTAIRSFIKKRGFIPNIKIINRERPCTVCNVLFTPIYSDGLKKDKYKTCSKECKRKHLSNIKTKYTQNQIDKVIELKKAEITNNKICNSTGMNINKVKEIIKDNSLFLTPEKAQQNAYQSKLEKDPFCMKKMREAHMKFTEEEFKERIFLLEKEVLNGNGSVSGLASKFGLIAASVVEFLKRNNKEYLLDIGGSTPQIELKEFLVSIIKEEIQYNTRKIISPLELDIYIPSISLAIEYCGLYWHSENQKDKNYHYNKMKLCNEKGIRLITIFEDEWLKRKEHVKNYIVSILGKNPDKIGARETVIKEVNKKDTHTFLEETHIQGSAYSEASFGLYYNDELIGVVTGNRHHRQGFENVLVLNRLSFKNGINVSGGSSKLLGQLINYAKNNDYSKIISWSDNRYSEGNVYKKIGFVLEEEYGPDYTYITGLKRISKQSCQKKQLLEKGAIGNTEHEMASSLGYIRIYDCGKKRWSYKL